MCSVYKILLSMCFLNIFADVSNNEEFVDNDNSDFSSTKARNLIKKINNNEDVENNKKALEKYLYKSVIDCILNINK